MANATTKLTKAQLASENAALRRDISQLKIDLEIKRIEYVNACEHIEHLNDELRIARGEKPIPQFLRKQAMAKLPDHMQAAKDLAIKTGRVVKIDADFDARR